MIFSLYHILKQNLFLLGNQYKITVNVSDSIQSLMHGGEVGILKIVLYGKNNTLKTDEMFFTQDPKYFVSYFVLSLNTFFP